MDTEIELKYFVIDENVKNKITQLLQQAHFEFEQKIKLLSNYYFDTRDLTFRRHDMGLRVRGCDERFEQTIKTAGIVVGGLHQRPEYNIDIESNYPELHLFPQKIWQIANSEEKLNTEKLQEQLISLFSTDFERIIWLVTMPCKSVIELAFDQGEISSDGHTDPICEIELELVSGNKQAIFDLARALFSVLTLRPSSQSKAARGYRLWKKMPTLSSSISDNNEELKEPLKRPVNDVIPLNNNMTLVSAFSCGVETCLARQHDFIELYLQSPSLYTLEYIVENLAMVRHGFWLFDEFLTEELRDIRNELSHFIHLLSWVDNAVNLQELTNKTGNYRTKLDYSEKLIDELKLQKRRLPNVEHVTELLHSERFNNLQLSLLCLIVNKETLGFSSSHVEAESIYTFAKKSLANGMQSVLEVMPQGQSLSSEQYLSQAKLLNRSLLTGLWLGPLFDSELRQQFRAPWVDVQEGISELQTLWIIQKQLEKLDEQPKKLMLWQQGKVEGLLLALDHSRQSALAIPVYWQ